MHRVGDGALRGPQKRPIIRVIPDNRLESFRGQDGFGVLSENSASANSLTLLQHCDDLLIFGIVTNGIECFIGCNHGSIGKALVASLRVCCHIAFMKPSVFRTAKR